jgi:plastocyanin
MSPFRWILVVVTAVAAAACGGAAPAAEAPASSSIDRATAAIVTGRVMFEGPAPEREMLRIDADRACVSLNGSDEQPGESLLLGENSALQNVFVYVKDGLARRSFPVPSTPVVIEQQKCRYTPRVIGIRVGQPLEIRNGDALLHNVRSDSAINQPFNQGQPVQGMVFAHTFTTREVMMPITCDVHRWMQAYVGALEHPYFAVTAAAGTFELPDLPPGTYTLEAWHEVLGVQTQQVTVGPKETKDVVFTFAR